MFCSSDSTSTMRTQLVDDVSGVHGGRRGVGMDERTLGGLVKHLVEVPQHRHAVAPRVLEVHARLTRLRHDQRHALVEPPAQNTQDVTMSDKLLSGDLYRIKQYVTMSDLSNA